MTGPSRRVDGGAGEPGPGVRLPPPLIFIAALAAGWWLDRTWTALPLSRAVSPVREGVGLALLVAGLGLVFWGMATFHRAGTAILPTRAASRFVTAGPYRFTRNPMYTGLATAYMGTALLLNTAWPILLLPLALVVLVQFVIHREEAHLARVFGAEYGAYCARVRRWL